MYIYIQSRVVGNQGCLSPGCKFYGGAKNKDKWTIGAYTVTELGQSPGVKFLVKN